MHSLNKQQSINKWVFFHVKFEVYRLREREINTGYTERHTERQKEITEMKIKNQGTLLGNDMLPFLTNT